MVNQKIALLFILTLSILLSCKKRDAPQISFYYWKTNFKLNQQEKDVLNLNKVKKLYVRYFDVNQNENQEEAQPVAPIVLDSNLKTYEVIPVVYIKNNVFQKRKSEAQLLQLAKNIHQLVNNINNTIGIQTNEIQFDCDWSETTATPYFYFINIFRELYKDTVSATLRLHQVKYAKITGVPPVDKVVLMYYNMSKINTDAQNSIYDRKVAQQYIDYLKYYTLPMDLALPIFGWGQRISNGKVVQLLNKININDFKTDTNFVIQSSSKLKAKHAFFKAGYYFKEGDQVKLESVSEKDLLQMADDISSKYKHPINTIIFYDLDNSNFNRYEKNIFEKVTHHFR